MRETDFLGFFFSKGDIKYLRDGDTFVLVSLNKDDVFYVQYVSFVNTGSNSGYLDHFEVKNMVFGVDEKDRYEEEITGDFTTCLNTDMQTAVKTAKDYINAAPWTLRGSTIKDLTTQIINTKFLNK